MQQTVTTACHHCLDPACANGCPTLAYEKDQSTGIVHHLDDQCMGCRYCEMKCPYEAPKYNDNLGIIRKCDMCQSRLEINEAPACVQACPNEAIDARGYADFAPMGHSVRVLREEEKGTISWRIKFRNGTEKILFLQSQLNHGENIFQN